MKTDKHLTAPTPVYPDHISRILEIIRSNLTPKRIGMQLEDFHEKDIAEVLELLTDEERTKLYRVLGVQVLADVLCYCEEKALYIEKMSLREQAAVLSAMEPADAAQYLQELEKQQRNLLLELMEEDAKKEVLLIGSFDEDEIGSKMSTNFISVRSGISVKQAMRELVNQAADNDNITTIYVVDEDQTLLGAIDLKDLIMAREGTALENITVSSYPYVYAQEQIDECIERLKDYSEDSIPVLDEKNRLTGVLTAQDITWLVDASMGDDYAKLGGLTAPEDIREPLGKSILKRLPWLAVLLVLGLLVSGVVGIFEKVVASLTLVICFQSLVLGMAGNAGTQSLAVSIRILTEGQLTGKEQFSLVLKELRVGLCNGLILGALSFVLVGLYLILRGEAAQTAFGVSACTGIALPVAMMLSSLSGTIVPLLFHKLKIDPAVASGPLITTINDLVAVVTYYSLAWFLLIQTLRLG